jgi:hypothetical protein
MGGDRIALIAFAVTAAGGCDVNSALRHLSEARRIAADLHVQFTRAADATNRAVMADTDETSMALAREAEEAKEAVRKDAASLAPILQALRYAEEIRLLEEFGAEFARYRALDQTILELAVLNTNLKAQRLSFGSAQEAADAFRDALQAVSPKDSARDHWRVKALAANAVAAVREIQALQAPHIAEPDDAVMGRMEERMKGAEMAARSALSALPPLVQPASRSQLASANAALDRFMSVHAEILAMSRRNTDVRSLVLARDQKVTLTAACDKSLRALREALAKRGYTGTR